jgi:hypothetical protein
VADDQPAGRIAARVVAALPRRARIRAIVCQLAGAVVAAVAAAGLVTPLAYAIDDGRTVDAAMLFLAPILATTIALAERGRRG